MNSIPFQLRWIDAPGHIFNFIVGESNVGHCDCELLCNHDPKARPPLSNPVETIHRVPATSTIIDLLVLTKYFPSKGQARKNWRGPIEIPAGYSEHVIGAGKKNAQFWFVNRPSPLISLLR